MWPAHLTRRALGAAIVGVLALAFVPTAASARKPIIAYVEGGQFKLYDAETGVDVTPPPVPVPASGFRFGISANGRYVFFNDAAKKLHLLDRQTDTEVPLPGIDIYPNPAFLTVSDAGRLAFDNNVNGPAVVYDSNLGSFVSTGFPATNKNRQTQLSPGGNFLITTCDSMTDCPTPTNGSDPFLQNLAAMTNVSLAGATDAMKDEEDPCIGGGANLVGWQKPNAVQKDIYIYDLASAMFLNLPNLNSATDDDTFCVLDRAGDYVGLMTGPMGNRVFKLYEVATGTFVPLPAKPFLASNSANAIFSQPFTPTPPNSTTGTPKKKCKKKNHKRRGAETAKKKAHCKKKKKKH